MSRRRISNGAAVALFCLVAALLVTGCGGGGGGPRTGALDGYIYCDSAAKGVQSRATTSTMRVGGSRSVGSWLPLQGATVTVGTKADTTDSRGKFYIGSINPGTYTVTISHPRYMPLSCLVTITAGQTTHLADQIMGAFYYVIVGIEDYPWPITDLAYCVDDAFGMRDVLTNSTGSHNWLRGYDPIVLTNAGATAASISGALTALESYMWPQDYLVFFFSGHGGQDEVPEEEPPQDEDDNLDEYLVAYDRLISDDELAGWVQAVAAYTGAPPEHFIFVLDSCYAGGIIRAKAAAKGGRGTETVTIQLGRGMESMARDLGDQGFTVLAACQDNQYSYEHPAIGHGLFSYAIMEALTTFRPDGIHLVADLTPYDGTITADELYQYVASRVPNLIATLPGMSEYSQNPVIEPAGCDTPLFKLVQ